MNVYESEKLLAEYLLFHYGSADEILPEGYGPREALDFPTRCINECVDLARLGKEARALDLGCAVGRATFELARHCRTVLGIDFSRRFIETAGALQHCGEVEYERLDEGELTTRLTARVPREIERSRVDFAVGDAMNLSHDLGGFDVLLAANLIDRLSAPQRCLARLPTLLKPGGQLVLTSPFTWLEEFTPRSEWLGGFFRAGQPLKTLDALHLHLDAAFRLITTRDMPFLIREHARKFQWSIAQATVWIRK
jgi:putative 4-mercaptohistidine N1-methyltranferase